MTISREMVTLASVSVVLFGFREHLDLDYGEGAGLQWRFQTDVCSG